MAVRITPAGSSATKDVLIFVTLVSIVETLVTGGLVSVCFEMAPVDFAGVGVGVCIMRNITSGCVRFSHKR